MPQAVTVVPVVAGELKGAMVVLLGMNNRTQTPTHTSSSNQGSRSRSRSRSIPPHLDVLLVMGNSVYRQMSVKSKLSRVSSASSTLKSRIPSSLELLLRLLSMMSGQFMSRTTSSIVYLLLQRAKSVAETPSSARLILILLAKKRLLIDLGGPPGVAEVEMEGEVVGAVGAVSTSSFNRFIWLRALVYSSMLHSLFVFNMFREHIFMIAVLLHLHPTLPKWPNLVVSNVLFRWYVLLQLSPGFECRRISKCNSFIAFDE
jgi:hypothetical protein